MPIVKSWTIGYQIYLEWGDGFVLRACARPAVGGAALPALGVEDYVYFARQRGHAADHGGATPLLAAARAPTDAELHALREATRAHLARIDAYGDVPPDTGAIYRDRHGALVLTLCPWSLALLRGAPTEGRATCTSGSQCACTQEDPPCAGPLTPADAASAETYWHAAACAAADALA